MTTTMPTTQSTTIPSTTHQPALAQNLMAPGTRSAADAVRSLPGSLRSEFIKITSVRSNGAIAMLAIAVSGFATWAVANFVTDEVLTTAEVFTFATVFTAVFAAVAGILMFSSESQHGTLSPMMTAQPSRAVIAVAKTIAAGSFGALLGLIGMAAAIAGSALAGIEFGDTSTMASDGGRALLFTICASVLGVGIGMIARHSAAAISGLLVWWLVVENLLSVFVSERYARFMPFSAGNAMVGAATGAERVDDTLLLSATENALVFGGYALAAVLIGAVLLKKVETD